MEHKKLIGLSLVSSFLIFLNGCGNDVKQEDLKNDTVKHVEKSVPTVTHNVADKEVVVNKKEAVTNKKEVETKASEKNSTSKEAKETAPDSKDSKASGNSSKGQKLYAKKLKKVCGMKGGEFAKKHTQDEWIKIEKDGKLADEIKAVCNGVEIKDKYLLDISAFLIEFASDSGNVPSC